jgi:hypothetical protein
MQQSTKQNNLIQKVLVVIVVFNVMVSNLQKLFSFSCHNKYKVIKNLVKPMINVNKENTHSYKNNQRIYYVGYMLHYFNIFFFFLVIN